MLGLNTRRMGATCGVLLVVAVAMPARAQPERRKTAQTISVMRDFEEIPAGTSRHAYFEIERGPGELGYSVVEVDSKKRDGGLRYAYHHEMALRLIDGTRIEADIKADLSPLFEPSEVHQKRTSVTAEGEVTSSEVVTRITDSQLTIESSGDMAEPRKTIKRPPSPFLYGLDAAVEMIDHGKSTQSIFYEFNPTNGERRMLGMRTTPAEGGGFDVQVGVMSGELLFEISLDAGGRVTEWKDRGIGLTIKRCDKSRLDELRAMTSR